MVAGDNNPRVFAQTIALDAWRKPFDGKRGEADLHIDVVFDERGRVGGGGAPVRFRLSLKRAEVYVIRDSENVIEIDPSSVQRSDLPKPGKLRQVAEQKARLSGKVGGRLSATSADMSVEGKAEGSVAVTETFEQTENISAMEVIHWRTNNGYGFKIGARSGKALKGQPWAAKTRLLKIRDTNIARERGEPPEIRVEIHCLREDLLIEDVEFTDASFPTWARLSRKTQIAVEQYIKDELARAGLPCGDLSDPFTRIVLADAMPSVES